MSDITLSADKYRELREQIVDLSLHHRLIAALLSADYIHPGVTEFRRILHHEFLPFTNQETAFKEDAAVFLKLQSILTELEIISTYPEFHKKRTVAVAGGFSAGKSQFISSLFSQQDLCLPTGIQPTTAIPTYAMSNKNGESSEVLGCSIRGGTVKLSDIEADLQNKLSHDFIRSFGFNLKSIMPYLFLSTPMPYEHLCFIDTPGYNPSDTEDGYTHEDNETAGEFIRSAEAVLWLIGADVNGTIPSSDLAFLREITEQDKPLYVILNKADLKSPDDIEDILDTIADILDDEDIAVAGIAAYSSVSDMQNDLIRGQEHSHRIESFQDFLNAINLPSNKQHDIATDLKSIETLYIDAIRAEEKRNKKITGQLKSLELDLFQKDFIRPGDVVSGRIDHIAGFFSNQNIATRLNDIKRIIDNLQQAVNQVFGGLPTYHDTHHISTPPDDPLGDISNRINSIKTQLEPHVAKASQSKVIDTINTGMEKIENIFSSFFPKD